MKNEFNTNVRQTNTGNNIYALSKLLFLLRTADLVIAKIVPAIIAENTGYPD